MKYLVTGAAGFIGFHVAKALLERGVEVVGFDNMNDYYDVALKKMRVDVLMDYDNFSFEEMDVEDYESLEKLFASHEFAVVLNLAGRAGIRASLDNPFVYMRSNAIGTLNLLHLMHLRGVNNFMTASTSSVYSGLPTPYTESLKVDTPISPYAASKRAAELIGYTYHHQYDINVSALRFFTVYGPYGRPDMSVLRFIRWIDNEEALQVFGDGGQSRDFTYIDDICSGILLACDKVEGYSILNLGGGNNPVSIIDLIGKLETIIGKKATIDFLPMHKADVQTTWADIAAADQEIDWKPSTGLDQGLQQTVDWYMAHKEQLQNILF